MAFEIRSTNSRTGKRRSFGTPFKTRKRAAIRLKKILKIPVSEPGIIFNPRIVEVKKSKRAVSHRRSKPRRK